MSDIGSGGSSSLPFNIQIEDKGDTWSGTQTLDLGVGDGHVFRWIVDQDLVFTGTVSGKPASGTQRTFELEFEHDGTANTYTITLPSNFVDENGNTISTIDISSNTILLSCRINNGTDFLIVRKNVVGAFGASQTPWLSNIDAATFELNNLSSLGFESGSSSISETTSDLLYNVAAVKAHKMNANGTTIGQFEEAAAGVYRLNMLNHTIKDAKDIRFDITATYALPNTIPGIAFDSANSRLRINVPTGDQVVFEEDGSGIATGVRINPASSGSVTTGTINVEDVLQFGVNATVPSVAGEMRSDGTDVTVYSGGALRNLSDISAGGSSSFDDDSFDIHDDADATKIAKFQASQISTSSTRTFTFQDKNGTLALLSDVGDLWPDPVYSDIIPDATSLRNIGETGKFFGSGFFNRIYFGDTNHFIEKNVNDLRYETPAATRHNFTVAGNQEMFLDSTGLTIKDGLIVEDNVTLGSVEGDDIQTLGMFVAPLKIATDIGKQKVVEMKGIDDSPDRFDLNLSSNVDMLIRSQANDILDWDASEFEVTHHQNSKFEKDMIVKEVSINPSTPSSGYVKIFAIASGSTKQVRAVNSNGDVITLGAFP